jgi:HD-like signal output (HDOD) protein/DNA-binding CsgD family transcriptional regulator
MHDRHTNDRRGQRLKLAFEALDSFPVLLASRERLLTALSSETAASAEVIAAVESDVALASAVLRLANTRRRAARHIETVPAALRSLDSTELKALARALPTFDFFEHAGSWARVPAQMRLHALSTQRAALRVAAIVGYEQDDRLAVTSLLHDIGKLVLAQAYPGYPAEIHNGARTPEERVQLERRELGVDHATIGGVALERWGLPASLAAAVERHHDARADGEAAIIRLADMLAHYEHRGCGQGGEMLRVAASLKLSAEQLRAILLDLHGPAVPRPRRAPDCPLTKRELELLRGLAKGGVYKQIAHELAMSVSTVRTHLHNVYGKLGVVNRAQAVLVASSQGWI